jgi:two-component system, OmpR family, response regulator
MFDKRVLVVDDDAAIRQMFTTLLVRQGYAVDCAHDGHDGLSHLRNGESYSAVILDLMMPKTSGFEMLDIVEQEQPETMHRIIVTTGVSSNDLRKLDSTRVFALVRKPFDIHELLRTVCECAEKANMVR